MKNNLKIDIVHWIDCHTALMMIRQKVFIEEQKVIPNLEWDGLDEKAIHFLALKNEKPVGCGRVILINDQMRFGRMAVLKKYRYQGVGTEIIHQLMMTAKTKHIRSINISAQCHAINFYQKFGFHVTSEIYLDAEIPHRDMVLNL